MLDPMMEQLLPGFIDECKEIVERLTEHLIELEKAHDQPRFDDLARGLHTLKGSAATLGLGEVSDLAHKMEDAVLPLRGRNAALPGAITDALLKTLDIFMEHLRATTAKSGLPDLAPSYKLLESVRHAVQAVDPGKAAANNGKPAREKKDKGKENEEDGDKEKPKEKKSAKRETRAAAPQPAAPEPAEEETGAAEEAGSWRVRTREVIALLHEVERLREVRLRLEERRREMERASSHLARLGMLAETAEVRALLMGVQRAIGADGEEAGDIVASMEDELKAICTLPVRTVLEPLRRSVRDLCKQSGKQARLSIVGGEVSLDRRVLESLRGPLVHLVRNAVDHGLEQPDIREARGKHREGIIVVRVEQQGNMLFIEVSDDGNGLDLALIKQAARDLSIVPGAELDAMTPAQLHQLIFRNGFSTRRGNVTSVSGRGVGMDVVRNQMQSLQGHIEVQSTPGQGTRFTLTLPAELGSSPVLVVRCGEHELGIPMPAVETSLLARPAELRVMRTRVQLAHREQLITVQDLGALLALRQPEVPHDGQPLLVLQSQGRRIALAVDEVIGDRELVIRPLPPEVRDLSAYQGAATLARGELVLIVRPDWLSGFEKRDVLTGTRRALVVDDSLTARALHRTALEAAGYSVHTASSGKQALEQLRHSSYDVMVSDIGMDEMDGFELTLEARRRSEFDAMPIILVSARDSDADRQRGAASGADGFLSKKDCASGRLLAEVQAVISRRQGAA